MKQHLATRVRTGDPRIAEVNPLDGSLCNSAVLESAQKPSRSQRTCFMTCLSKRLRGDHGLKLTCMFPACMGTARRQEGFVGREAWPERVASCPAQSPRCGWPASIHLALQRLGPAPRLRIPTRIGNMMPRRCKCLSRCRGCGERCAPCTCHIDHSKRPCAGAAAGASSGPCTLHLSYHSKRPRMHACMRACAHLPPIALSAIRCHLRCARQSA